VAVALIELGLREIAAHLVDPTPDWLDVAGRFSYFFTGTLAAGVVGARCMAGFTAAASRDVVVAIGLALAAFIATIPLLVDVDLAIPTEILFGIVVIALVVTSLSRDHDLGAQVGLVLVALPLVIHVVAALGGQLIWPDQVFAGDRDMAEAKRLLGATGPEMTLLHLGTAALCFAALTSPYCFAPRPFARAVTRPIPVVIAMATAALGAVIARTWYPAVADLAWNALGIGLDLERADRWLAIYLLAIATLVWTIASCAIAASPSRRTIGLGLTLVVLGGYAFQHPHHYLLPLLGLTLIADATRRVRDEELSSLPIVCETPPIIDTTWSTYIGALTTGLRRTLGDVHSLTTRSDTNVQSSIVVGDKAGMQVRTRIERIDGCVLSLDVVVGREIDELRGATLTLHASAPRGTGTNPAAPPATPAFKSGDAAFDDHFRSRGNAAALAKLFDDGLRARAVTSIDGWLAYWDGEGLRYRVYPGRGAPIDHPMPLSDLALGRSMTNAERVVSVVELLVEVASRGVKTTPTDDPVALDLEPAAVP
jgi:hypothetical protein